jgi:hypothetical protein
MIETYLEEYGKARPMGKTKKAALEAIGLISPFALISPLVLYTLHIT